MPKVTPPEVVKQRKDDIIRHLAAGMSLTKACLMASCPQGSLHRYRNLDVEFGEEVNRLLSSPEHQARIAASQGRDAPAEWTDQEKFIYYYEGCKDRAAACNRAGIRPSDLMEWLDEKHPKFDAKFADDFMQVQLADEMRVMDMARRKALVDKESSMIRFLLGGSKGNSVSIQADGDVFVVDREKDNSIRRELNERFSSKSS